MTIESTACVAPGVVATVEQPNASALTIEQAAKLIRQPVATVERHVAAGLPTDANGRIHLVDYTAWLVKRLVE